jgi:caa(3)-type oxidase subunit IV
MSDPVEQASRPARRTSAAAAYRTGWWVFLVLIALTVLEYIVALVMDANLPVMVVMNVVDAGLIMYYFMHVRRLWRRTEEA